jgi:hypothetical protein
MLFCLFSVLQAAVGFVVLMFLICEKKPSPYKELSSQESLLKSRTSLLDDPTSPSGIDPKK